MFNMDPSFHHLLKFPLQTLVLSGSGIILQNGKSSTKKVHEGVTLQTE